MDTPEVLMIADPSDVLADTLRALAQSANPLGVTVRDERIEVLDASFRAERIAETLSRRRPCLILLVLFPFARVLAETLVRTIHAVSPQIPLLLAIESCQPTAKQALFESGVTDFITPPLIAEDVVSRIGRILHHTNQTESLTRDLKEKLGLRQLIGTSRNFLEEVRKLPLVAKCDANVLISGETGTGKELCARAIHYLSARASQPLVPVNCGATPTDLLDNELFGHERGAYTGAIRSEPGLIEEANGGTLFLDEIDCLPHHAQVKLLRFIQEKEYRRLGSTKVRSADVRIISATNAVLENAVREGKFRPDLFFRINIIPVRLPALRERGDDIPLLVQHFLAKYATEFKKPVIGFSSEAMRNLVSYEWPGNVRELEHVVQRAIALSEGAIIQQVDVGSTTRNVSSVVSFQDAKAKVVEEFERAYIHGLLLTHRGNISRAASAARKNRRAFWELIRKHGIDAQRFKPEDSAPQPDNFLL